MKQTELERADEMLREYIAQTEQIENESENRANDDCCGCDGECCAYAGCLACLNM